MISKLLLICYICTDCVRTWILNWTGATIHHLSWFSQRKWWEANITGVGNLCARNPMLEEQFVKADRPSTLKPVHSFDKLIVCSNPTGGFLSNIQVSLFVSWDVTTSIYYYYYSYHVFFWQLSVLSVPSVPHCWYGTWSRKSKTTDSEFDWSDSELTLVEKSNDRKHHFITRVD